MFDVLDILVPELKSGSGIDRRRRASAFGESAEEFAYACGVEFARIASAAAAYTDVAAWTGAADRREWTVLLAHVYANDSADSDERWRKFLGAVLSVLRAHETWRVTCESDCDQHPFENIEASPEDVCRLLDEHRSRPARPIALRATRS